MPRNKIALREREKKNVPNIVLCRRESKRSFRFSFQIMANKRMNP